LGSASSSRCTRSPEHRNLHPNRTAPGRGAELLQLAQRFGTQDDGALRLTHELT